MGGFGSMDHMVKSYRANRKLLKGTKKSLKRIYQENNFLYTKKRIQIKIKKFDPEKKRIFLEKFHRKQRRIRLRRTLLSIFILVLFVLVFLYNYSSNLIP